MKLVRLIDKRNAYEIKIDYLLSLDEMVKRVYYECEILGKPLPVNKGEVFTYCVEQIQRGCDGDVDDYDNDELYDAITARLKHLFPELS